MFGTVQTKHPDDWLNLRINCWNGPDALASGPRGPWGHQQTPASVPSGTSPPVCLPWKLKWVCNGRVSIKMVNNCLSKIQQKSTKKDITWYLSEIHVLGSHWVTAILRHCGCMSKYSPLIDFLSQPKLWATLAQPRGQHFFFYRQQLKSTAVSFPPSFCPSLVLFFMAPVICFLSLQECAKQELEASESSQRFSWYSPAMGRPGEKAPYQSLQGEQRGGGRRMLRVAASRKKKTHMAASQPASGGSSSTQAAINWQGGTEPRKLESPPANLSKMVPRRKLRAAEGKESHQPPCDYGAPNCI